MGKGTPNIDYQKCLACGICAMACPFSALELGKTDVDKLKNAYPLLLEQDTCTGCGLCAKACPLGCIKLGGAG